MTTVINNPGETQETKGGGLGAGSGVVIGAALVIIVLVVVIVLALPYIRKEVDSVSNVKPIINVELPELPSSIPVTLPNTNTTTP